MQGLRMRGESAGAGAGAAAAAAAMRCALGAGGATCRLCYCEAGAGAVALHDEVTLRSGDALELRDILAAVAGSVIDEEMLPEILCAACTAAALASFRFLLLCRDSLAAILRAADALYRCRLPPPASGTLYLLVEGDAARVMLDRATAAGEPRALDRVLALARRRRRRPDEPRHQCEDCGKVFSREPAFRRHLALHAQPHACALCTNTYASRGKLAAHVARAHDEKLHACPDCGKRFGSPALVDEHRKAMHTSEACRHCGRAFGNKHARRAHELSHGARWPCARCAKTFKYKEGLKRHASRCLSGEPRERFACDDCGRAYSNKGTLVQHARYAHGAGGDALACDDCGRKFLDRGKLECHRSRHTGVKRFPCDACGARFSYPTTLTYHVRAFHTGEKPYACDACPQRFITSSARLVHARRYHGAPAPACARCGLSFVTRARLARHVRKLHRDLTSDLLSDLPSDAHHTSAPQ